MADPHSFRGKVRLWAPPTMTRLAIGKETKSVAAEQSFGTATTGVGAEIITEPQAPSRPASKFGFSFEWSFPVSARND
jgi:hypothetical protein